MHCRTHTVCIILSRIFDGKMHADEMFVSEMTLHSSIINQMYTIAACKTDSIF